MDASGCVSLRSSRHQVISLRAIKIWRLWSLDITNAFSQAGGFTRGVLPQAPVEWEPLRSSRVRKLEPPAFALNDAPAAFHRSLGRRTLDSEASIRWIRHASSFGSSPFFIFRETLTLVIFLGAGNQMFCPRFEIFRNGVLAN